MLTFLKIDQSYGVYGKACSKEWVGNAPLLSYKIRLNNIVPITHCVPFSSFYIIKTKSNNFMGLFTL